MDATACSSTGKAALLMAHSSADGSAASGAAGTGGGNWI
jgi:hypothetical protein